MIRYCLLLFLLAPAIAGATTLEYSVAGLEGEPERNVLAHLGPAPETDQDRLNFVVAARNTVRDGLKALGYYQPDIDIEVQRTDPVWTMNITVAPGEPVRIRDVSIQVLGEAANDPEFSLLVSSGGIVVGEVLHHGRFEDFRNSLLSLGQRRGYLDGEITVSRVEVRVATGTAEVVVRYDSGPRFRYGEITHDSAIIDEKLFKTLLNIRAGEFYDQASLKELQSQLQRTNYFSSVVIQPDRERAVGNIIPINVELRAANQHGFEVGVGYATDTEERVSVIWRTPKINRYGHSQVTRLQYSPVNPSGRFTYSIPIAHPLNDIVQLWARVEENEYGDIDSQQSELGVRRETKSGQWIYGYSLRGLNESWDVLDTSHANNYLLLGGSVSSRQHQGSLVDPSSGFHQLYTLEGGNHQLESDVDVLRFTAALRYVFTPLPRNRVVGRAELGAVEIANGERTDLAPSLGFFAGGSQSIRGYAYQSLGPEIEVEGKSGRTRTIVVGGDRLVTGSLEYQYYFTDRWRGALFVDGGDAFDEGDFDTKVGAGFGVHYITQVGAIRVELANSVSEDDPDWYFHLTIGVEF